jgi:hypothetical protein
MSVTRSIALVALVGSALPAHAQELRNWFNDPFAQVSSAIPNCPVPLGPLVTEAQRREQSHHRAEKGTTCWLAHQCDKPNYYAYDAEIAERLKAALAKSSLLAHTSLWITVQGRVIFIEGCVRSEAAGARLESLAHAIPYVQQAIANVYVPGARLAKPHYRLLNETPVSKAPP